MMQRELSRRSWLLQASGAATGFLTQGSFARVQIQPRLLCGELPPLTDPLGLTGRVEQIARAAGYLQAPLSMPWQRAWREARMMGSALMFPVARIPEREPHWQWLSLLGHEQIVLLVRRDALVGFECLPPLAKLSHLDVGVLRDSMLQTWANEKGFRNIEPAVSDRVNTLKLSRNRIQAWAALGSVADHWLAREGLSEGPYLRIRFTYVPIYLVGTPDLPPASVLPWMDAGERVVCKRRVVPG